VSTLADAPAAMTAMEAVAAALDAAGAVLGKRRDMTRRRQAVIAANPSLQQGEQVKYAMLAADMAEALRGRGVEPLSARLAADAGVAVFRAAFERWVDEDEKRDFGRLARDTLDELAAEFDRVHSIQRALAVGSVDRIIPARELRPYLIDAVERGLAHDSGHLVTAGGRR